MKLEDIAYATDAVKHSRDIMKGNFGLDQTDPETEMTEVKKVYID